MPSHTWKVRKRTVAAAEATQLRSARYLLNAKEDIMGRGILLFLLGVPLPIIILLAIFWH
jgi:hypothetical protein